MHKGRWSVRSLPAILVTAWLAVVGVTVYFHSSAAVEPPGWDALSYVQKAQTFWSQLHQGTLFNPFALPPTVRPPGTVLISYPFGFSPHFQGFYFRSVYIPIVLLVGAIYVAGIYRDLSAKGHWVVATLALVIGGIPCLYQFQSNQTLPAVVSWGLVDNFLAGMAALAIACSLRSINLRSKKWAAVSAVTAGFCFLIKPSGLLVIGVVGLVWLISAGSEFGWSLSGLREDWSGDRFFPKSLVYGSAICALFVGAGVFSPYFSAENMAFGNAVLSVMHTEFHFSLTIAELWKLITISFGYILPLVFLLGVVLTLMRRDSRAGALGALVCVAAGAWFWLGKTDTPEIRYFVPFGTMAFTVLTPYLVRLAEGMSAKITLAAGVAGAPAILIAVLLVIPSPSIAWQRAAGVNLLANSYEAENQQAKQLLDDVRASGSACSIYFLDLTPPLRNLIAVFNYNNLLDSTLPPIDTRLPIDWVHASAVRFDDLLGAKYVAFEPIRTEERRNAILSQLKVASIQEQTSLVSAWFSALSEADGVELVSETHARVLHIRDASKLEASLARLQNSYSWSAAFRDANPTRWLSPAEMAQLARDNALAGISFRPEAPQNPDEIVSIRAEVSASEHGELQAKFWVEPKGSSKSEGWYLFAHLVDAEGMVLANKQAALVSGPPPSADRPIRSYTISYESTPPTATAIAFGLYHPESGNTAKFFNSDAGRDWAKRRVWLPLPTTEKPKDQ